MFLLKSENDLVEAFRSKDQKQLELPPGQRFPLVVRDYFAWSQPGGTRVFVVFSEPGVNKPIGVVFERPNGSGTAAAMCEWCHSFGSTSQIGLLILEVDSRRKVGINLCLDLSCREKIESNLSLTAVAAQGKVRQVVEHMSRFIRRTVL